MNIIPGLVWAIIPARSGSKGVPDKNIRLIGGHPLLTWSIMAARRSRHISRVLVSTDSRRYADLANQYGGETPFLRPARHAADDSRDIDFLRHALMWLHEHGDSRIPEYLVHLRPTTPLRRPEIIDQAIEIILSDPDATSLCSAHETYPPCKYFQLNGDGTFSALLGEQYISLPRQQCPRAYNPDGYVDVLKTEQILTGEGLYGHRRLAFISRPTPDIDTEEDWANLERDPLVAELAPVLFGSGD